MQTETICTPCVPRKQLQKCIEHCINLHTSRWPACWYGIHSRSTNLLQNCVVTCWNRITTYACTCKSFRVLPFTLVIVLFISIYYSYITITQWLVGSGIKAKRGVASAKKCTACGPVYAAHVQTYLFCTLELNDDYYNVLSDLNPLAARWKNIGFALRLKPDALERIDREHGGDLSACLASMVKEWLKRNYNVERFGKPTWQRLAEACSWWPCRRSRQSTFKENSWKTQYVN